MRFVGSPGYQAFLEYMCPGATAESSTVPLGGDPSECQRAILGVWDDHDYGWNNGNRRLPNKQAFKQLYLDAIGESANSPRRSMVQGMQGKVTFNPGTLHQSIDVFLLDERYYRSPLPCQVRARYCSGIVNGDPEDVFEAERTSKTVAWCQDFLFGGPGAEATCCFRDEELSEWCKANNALSSTNATWTEACDPTSNLYGRRNLVVRGSILQQANPSSSEDMAHASQFCDVLGRLQRSWLREALQHSRAPLKLVASGSVLFGNPSNTNSNSHLPSSAKAQCSGDDWDCYQPAQLNLIHTLGNATDGCVVVLTGDYHFADIKAAFPDTDGDTSPPYSGPYATNKLGQPIYQVMSSGLSESTAPLSNLAEDCTGFMRDEDGLRLGGKCSMYTAPNFGMVEVDWGRRRVELSIRTKDGSVAEPGDPTAPPLRFEIDLDTCQVVPADKG